MPGDRTCSACLRSFPHNHYVGVGGRRCTRCAACRRTAPAPLPSVATPAPATLSAPSLPSEAPAPAPPTTPPASAQAPVQPTLAVPSIGDASALPPPSALDTSAHSRLDEQADTITQLAESVAEIRQLVLSLRRDLAQPAAVPSLPAASAISPSSGELQLRRLFPWISRELAQQVYDDRLPPHELGKLRNPAHNTANSEPERELRVVVNGVRVSVPAPSSADASSRSFLRLIPDARSFAQAWAVYAALRCTSENNPHLAASLNAFLVHIIDLDTQYYWSTVADHQEIGLAAMVSPILRPSRPLDHVGSSPRQTQARSPMFSSLQQTQAQQGFVAPLQHSSLQRTQAQLGHVGPSPSPSPQQTQARLLTLVPAALDVPSADRCLSLLLALRQHSPPPRPNTTLARDVFDPDSSPARIGSMQTQLHAWRRLLQDYPDERFRSQVAGMIEHGCLLGYNGPLRGSNRPASNLPIDDAGHAHLRREIAARLEEGRLTIVGHDQPLVESPIGVVPKPRSSKLRTIHHLSHPRRPASTTLPSVNSGIDPAVVRIQYETIGNLVDFVRANPHCRLWKGDLEDAFRHVVTAESDARLLGFQYNGTRYRENALTFGGSSSPFLFNLVAEFLHWVVASCLPQSWPVNHYLDDTFGAVPAEAPALALLPVRVLALAAAALGLRLSPKKTFADLTRLEILGIDIDSAAQTVGITPERRAHILAQCRTLLSRGTADLLDMQRIAGLLQFVAQVFPCGKAFLRRLYDCTRRARTSGRRRIPRPALAELAWWVAVLDTWHGTCILAPSPLRVAHVWTDACPRGYGAHLGLAHNPTAAFSKEVPRRHRGKNICFLEALAVLEALRRFLPYWTSPTTVVIHVDNENVEHGLRSGSSRDPLTQRLIREIFGLCFVHNLTLHPVRVTSTDNVLADLLSRRQFARIRHLGISASAATLLWNGLAASTRDRAGSTITAYRTFCAFRFGPSVACFPASGLHLLEWLGSMSTAGRSYHSAKHELGHLRSHHIDLGLSLHGFECGRLERALRGYKRIHGARRTGAKLPITLPLLRRLVLALDTFADLSTWDRAVFGAAFTLSFACFLRSGEVVWDRLSDPGTILRVASVELAADHAIVTLPASKTDPFRLGVKVVAPLVGGPECPVERLRVLTAKRAASAPLFGLGRSGTEPLTRSAFVATLRRAIAWAGLEPAAYAGHSFRRSAATWAARLGASPDTIQCLGRWNSDCFRRYVDRSATERRDLSVSALFAVRDGPLVPDSTSWRDVGAV
ncbi:uncharacterized protein UTRI_03968 [Ustilago trichophora]|uniref:Reverse transcriptase domain-containing protein n=1 Tax=Ustilago trichophora TaxID=86804 RepID=A0A5C3EB10_9BASI|nr:uncharacterized protein UTRI_03968 [Ustilago trichophora]